MRKKFFRNINFLDLIELESNFNVPADINNRFIKDWLI